MIEEARYHAALQALIATAVGNDLPLRSILDGLMNQLAAVAVSSTASKTELEECLEHIRHSLDLKVIEYDRRSGSPVTR